MKNAITKMALLAVLISPLILGGCLYDRDHDRGDDHHGSYEHHDDQSNPNGYNGNEDHQDDHH